MVLSGEVGEEAAHQLVDEARLAGAAGAGDAEHRHSSAAPRQRVERRAQLVAGLGEVLGDGDERGDRRRVALGQLRERRGSNSGARFSKSHRRSRSLIMPCRPIARPSSGE